MRSPARIDEINILQATYEAMREAIGKLNPQPTLLLNDAVTIPEVEIPQIPIIKGDAKSISIGAASIIAKVTRDRLMVEYDRLMPEYECCVQQGLWFSGAYSGAEDLRADAHSQKILYRTFCGGTGRGQKGRRKVFLQENKRRVGDKYERLAAGASAEGGIPDPGAEFPLQIRGSGV